MTDLAALLKAATPEPPLEVSLAALHPHRRRSFAPLAAASVVLAVTVGISTSIPHHTNGPAGRTTVTTFLDGVHLRHPAGWVYLQNLLSAGPGFSEYLTNVPVATHCGRDFRPSCVPGDRLRGDQVLITVTTSFKGELHLVPNRVVAGRPAVVITRMSSSDPCRAMGGRKLSASINLGGGKTLGLTICTGRRAASLGRAIMASAYLDRPAPTNLGIVTGRLLVVGGPPPAAAGPVAGTVRIGSRSVVVGSDGYYAVAVPPGNYVVTGRSPHVSSGRGPEICSSGNAAHVRSGAVVQKDVTCQID